MHFFKFLKSIIVFICALACINTYADIVIHLERIDGKSNEFIINSNTKISIDKANNRMNLSGEDFSFSVDLSQIKNYSFKNREDNVDKINSDSDFQASFKYSGNKIYIPSYEKECRLNVYTLSGILLKNIEVSSHTPTIIDLSDLESGTYVSVFDIYRFKIVVR